METQNKIPISEAKCTGLSMQAPVTLAMDGGENADFEIDAYTGNAVDRWWGKLAVSIEGIKAKQKMPILLNHNTDKIVGYSMKSNAGETFVVTGKFSSSTDAAKETKALAEEGFPWQASIGVKPLTIVEIKSGTAMEVNGKMLDGPAEIWLESEVYETSFVPLGADSDTSVAMLTRIEELAQGAETEERLNMPISLEALQKEAPELLEQIKKDALNEGVKEGMEKGAQAELERIKSVYAQMYPGHEDLVSAAMFDGKSQAGDVAMRINEENLKLMRKAGDDLSGDAPPVVPEVQTTGLKGEEQEDERPLEDKCEDEWKKSKALRAEFGSLETYTAFKKAEAENSFKYLRNKETK